MSLRGIYPSRVHEQDGVQYFYWDWDLYKPFDYEPIYVHSNPGSKSVISRFHWHVATIWTESVEEDNKPKVNFVRGIHTPIVESKSDAFRYFEFEPNVPVEERIAVANLYIPLFLKLWKSVEFSGKEKSYGNLIVEDKIPEQYLFRFSEIKSSLLIGRFPKPEDLPQALREKLWPE